MLVCQLPLEPPPLEAFNKDLSLSCSTHDHQSHTTSPPHLKTGKASTYPETFQCHLNYVEPIQENVVAIPPSSNPIFSFIHLSSKGKETKDDSLNTFIYNINYINL